MSLNYTERKETSFINYILLFSFLEIHHPRDRNVHVYSSLLLFIPVFTFINVHSHDKNRHFGFLFFLIIPIPIFWGFYIPNNRIFSGIGFLIFLPIFPIIRGDREKDDFHLLSIFLLFIPLFSLFYKYNKSTDNLDLIFLFLILPILVSRSQHPLGIFKLFKSQEGDRNEKNEKTILNICPNCGVQLEEEEVFCSACGTKIPH